VRIEQPWRQKEKRNKRAGDRNPVEYGPNNCRGESHWWLTLEVSGRCHSERQITVARRSGPLDRIVSLRRHDEILGSSGEQRRGR